MAIRFGVPLPGPFYFTAGSKRRSKKSQGNGCALLVVVFVLGAAFAVSPVLGYVVLSVAAVLTALALVGLHKRVDKSSPEYIKNH